MTTTITRKARRWLALLPALAWLARGQQPSAQPSPVAGTQAPQSVTVEASKQWVDTGINVRGGATVHFSASGEITYPEHGKTKERQFGPEGLARGYADLIRQYAVVDGGHGALIGRVGPAESAQPFLIGESIDFSVPVSGRLFLGINQSARDASSAQGSFLVNISVTGGVADKGAAFEAGGPAEVPIPAITAALIEQIPRRVSDASGRPGDMVNVMLVGTEDEVVQAFATAGWVKVDTSVASTVVSGILDTLEKKSYLTMPMSSLYLFGRAQDFGFAHAEPVRVAMSRHHLRAWKSSYEINGRPLWCISATHDVGFERDQRNQGITHKIDPSIDGEREFVNASLTGTGLVVRRTHVTPATPLKEAETATGGSFHSDGRILVLVLKKK